MSGVQYRGEEVEWSAMWCSAVKWSGVQVVRVQKLGVKC